MRLKDRVAIVTGAARGIGQTYCLALAHQGARVVATDVLSCAETVAKVQQAGGEALGIMADVAGGAASLVSRVGYDVLGSPELREAIAAHYGRRGVPTSPSEVLVTTGAQSAIHLVASVLLGRGDRVVVETPTYPHAVDALRRAGARLVGVPVTTDAGWDLDRAEQAFARTLGV